MQFREADIDAFLAILCMHRQHGVSSNYSVLSLYIILLLGLSLYPACIGMVVSYRAFEGICDHIGIA